MNDDAVVGLLGGLTVLFSGVFVIIMLAFAAVMIASIWKVFSKTGRPGWAAIVPLYNAIVLLDIVGKPIWWILLLMIPLVNIVVGILVCIDLAKSFGKPPGFAFGLVFLGFIFFPILGFGSARYAGPVGVVGAPELKPTSF
ncbi:MAG: DUF5684 domain-containing protein [Acidobacteriota bacterium]